MVEMTPLMVQSSRPQSNTSPSNYKNNYNHIINVKIDDSDEFPYVMDFDYECESPSDGNSRMNNLQNFQMMSP